MRVLLDENVPRKLKYRFGTDFVVSTVQENGWSGIENGALLRAAHGQFDAFVTLDRGLVFQQDLSGLSLHLIVVRSAANKYDDLLPLVPAIESALSRLKPGHITYVAG